MSAEVLKEPGDENIKSATGLYDLNQFNDLCDHCLTLPNIGGDTNKAKRLKELTQLSVLLHSLWDKKPDKNRFTRTVFSEEFLSENRFSDDRTSQNMMQTVTVHEVEHFAKKFMDEMEIIKDDVFQEDGLNLLSMKT
jgi:hypothetical protein